METLVQFLERLATKAGVAAADPNLAALIANPALAQVSIPAELVSGIDNNILSLAQAADNHPALKRQYHAQVLNAFDKRIDAIMKEAGLAPEVIANLEKETNTYNRFDQLTAAIKEASVAAGKSKGSPEDKTLLQKQVEDLLAQLKTQKESAQAELATVTEARQKDRVSFELSKVLGSVKTVFDDLPAEARQAALESLITRALQDSEASFNFDENNSLVLKGAGDTAVVGANNVKYTPQTFIEEKLAQNKVLKVAEATPTTTSTNGNNSGNNRGGNTTVVRGESAQVSGTNVAVAASNRAMRELFEKQSAER